MDKPKVSIVIANYNQERFLKKTIQSCLDQTYQNWELIIVDDGSTDQSRQIIEEFRDDRIRPFYLEKNRHICYATNYGLSRVQGEFVARLDSDDIWRADKLEKQVHFFEEHPESSVCFTKLDLINENEEIVNDKLPELYDLYNSRQAGRKEWLRFFFFYGNSLIQSSMMYRTDCLHEVGMFHPALAQSHDMEFFVRLIKKYDFSFIEEPLTLYRRYDTQNSENDVTKDRRFFNEHMIIRKHFFDHMPDELFIEAFSDDFVNPQSRSHEELLCEQAFLLKRCIYGTDENPVLGVSRLEKLFLDPVMQKVLEEKFGYIEKDFYKDNQQRLYYSASDQPDDIRSLLEENLRLKRDSQAKDRHIQLLLEINEDYKARIANLEESFSQKVIRKLKKR